MHVESCEDTSGSAAILYYYKIVNQSKKLFEFPL